MSIMNAAVSGMKAQSNRLATVGDNIANASTAGYKKTSTQFSALVLPSSSSSYTAGGVETTVRRAVSLEGGLTSTASATDLAIRGNGFFVVEDNGGGRYLTRAGSFVPDEDGYLYNAGGYYLTGYSVKNGAPNVLVNSLNGGERINVKNFDLQAVPTTSGVFKANLDARAGIVAAANLPGANASTAQFTSQSSIVVYDNLGGEVKLDVYFTKTAADTWQVAVFDQRDRGTGATAPFPYATHAGGAAPIVRGTQTLTFDATNGKLTTASAKAVDINVPGGSATMSLDLSGLTALKADYQVSEPSVNGNAPSAVTGVTIGNNGIVSLSRANGTSVDAYRIPLADVASPDNLTALSGGVFQVSNGSGAAQVGFPQQGALGSINANALEASNVDLADELASMIEAQRNYQANSKSFQTGAEILEVLVNLKR